jgi:hypothetical protein
LNSEDLRSKNQCSVNLPEDDYLSDFSRMSRRLKKIALFVAALAGLEAGSASAQQLSLNITPSQTQADSEPNLFQGLNLGGGFIEFLLTGRISPVRMSMMLLTEPPRNSEAFSPSVQIVSYEGPIAPGSVVLNVTKKTVYRILPDRMMEVYPQHTDISSVLKSRLASVD